jgi:DNA-binding beta-propeller fold protein YncE
VKHTNHYNYVVSFLLLSMSAQMCAVDYAVVATINTGVNPAGIALTPNNHHAYVANNNNYDIAGQDSVSVLNLKHNKPETIINDASFSGPYTVTIDHKGQYAYVTNSNSTTISIIDIKQNMVVGTLDGFDGPSGMVIKPHGEGKNKIAYVNNYGSAAGVGSGNGHTISVVDLKAGAIIATIDVDQAPAALAISHDGNHLYVVNYVDGNPGTGTMQIINTADNSIMSTTTGFSGPFDIAVKHDEKYAYVTNFGSNNFAPFGNTVSVVRLRKCQPYIKDAITVGIQPSGIAIKPDQHFAFVTNFNELYDGTQLIPGQGTVNVIDLHSKEVVSPTIVVGQGPSAVALSSNGRHIYVTNYTSNTVTVIEKVEDENDGDNDQDDQQPV